MMDVLDVNKAFGKLVIGPQNEQALSKPINNRSFQNTKTSRVSLNNITSKPLAISDRSKTGKLTTATAFPKSKIRPRTNGVINGNKPSGVSKITKQPQHHQHKYSTKHVMTQKFTEASRECPDRRDGKSASIDIEMQVSPTQPDSCSASTQEHQKLLASSTLALMPHELVATLPQELIDLISRHDDVDPSEAPPCGQAHFRDLDIESWIEDQEAAMKAEGKVWHGGDEFHRKMDLLWSYLYEQESREMRDVVNTIKEEKEAAVSKGVEPELILNIEKSFQTWTSYAEALDRIVRRLRTTSDEEWEIDCMEEDLGRTHLGDDCGS